MNSIKDSQGLGTTAISEGLDAIKISRKGIANNNKPLKIPTPVIPIFFAGFRGNLKLLQFQYPKKTFFYYLNLPV